MNILYATDENYAEIACVSIESLLDHNKDVDIIRLFIVEDGLSSDSKQRLTVTAEKHGRSITFIPHINISQTIGTKLHTLRWSDCAFSRLFLDRVFKDYPEIEKIIYLDCDVLVLGSLKPLWELDLRDSIGAAVYECMGNWHKAIIGAKKTDDYFNTGVMLLSIANWSKRGASERCTEYIRNRKGKIEYVDQGVVNGALAKDFMVIEDPRYNLTSLAWDFSYEEMVLYRKPHHGYSKETWEKALSNPAVVHFTTSFLSTRPWFEGSDTPYTAIWRKYHGDSVWRDTPYRVMANRNRHERLIKAFNVFPRPLAIAMAGFMHSYIKPIVFWIR